MRFPGKRHGTLLIYCTRHLVLVTAIGSSTDWQRRRASRIGIAVAAPLPASLEIECSGRQLADAVLQRPRFMPTITARPGAGDGTIILGGQSTLLRSVLLIGIACLTVLSRLLGE